MEIASNYTQEAPSALSNHMNSYHVFVMNLYYYMPKYEKTLPYYDVFPLVIPIKRLPGGFLGLNFHYLSVPLRMKLMEKLLPMTKENRIIGWTRVSKFRFVVDT